MTGFTPIPASRLARLFGIAAGGALLASAGGRLTIGMDVYQGGECFWLSFPRPSPGERNLDPGTFSTGFRFIGVPGAWYCSLRSTARPGPGMVTCALLFHDSSLLAVSLAIPAGTAWVLRIRRRRARRRGPEPAAIHLDGATMTPDASERASPMNKVTPFLMFSDRLEEAIAFYIATFPNSELRHAARTGTDGPICAAEFVVGGQRFMGYNGGSYFSFSEGVSLYVDCADQAEVDAYWERLVNAGATPTQCGWIKDPFGLSWQIVPRRFIELIRDPDPRKVKAVMDAMMTMVKLDVAELERAYNGA